MEITGFLVFFYTSLKISFNTCPPILWTWDSPANPKLSLLEAFICLVSRSIINSVWEFQQFQITENFNLYSVFLSTMEGTRILAWLLFLNSITKSNPWSSLQWYWAVSLHLDRVSKTPSLQVFQVQSQEPGSLRLSNSFLCTKEDQPYCCHSWQLSTSLLERRWLSITLLIFKYFFLFISQNLSCFTYSWYCLPWRRD